MQFEVNEDFTLEPTKTSAGIQIRYGYSPYDPESEATRTRWYTFRNKHINTRVVGRNRIYLSMKDANDVCRDFVKAEKKRKEAQLAKDKKKKSAGG